MVSALDNFKIDNVTEIINDKYDNGKIPEDISKSIIIALLKLPDANSIA